MNAAFTAGPFDVEAYGKRDGSVTLLTQRGSGGAIAGSLRVSADDLPDLIHVLKRAVKFHEEDRR